MADNIQRYGFRYHGNRGYPSPVPEKYPVASNSTFQDTNSATVNLNVGDVVKKVNDGTVALAAATDAFFGIVINILPYYDSVAKVMTFGKSLPGPTPNWGTNYANQTFVEIVVVAGFIWEVDCNDNTTATTFQAYQTFIGENMNHINTGDTTNLTANPQLNVSGHATTNSLQWRCCGISPSLENADFTGKYVKLLVTANISQQAGGGAGSTTGV